MKRINGKNYFSQKEIHEKLRTIYIDDMNDVATYCEWIVVYEGEGLPVIQGICHGITMTARAIKNTKESHLTFSQLRNLLRELMHGNVEIDIHHLTEGCHDRSEHGWKQFLENEGIAICLSEIRDLEQSHTR
jgi:hypothetical protein